MNGLAAPAPTTAEATVAPVAAVDPSKLEGEAETRFFAEQMRAEKEAEAAKAPAEPQDAPEVETDKDKAEPAKAAQKPGKAPKVKEFDSAKVVELLKAGDIEAVAKEAGIDLRVTSKDWAAFRNEQSKEKHKLNARAEALTKRESELSSIVETTKQSAANIIKAAEHVKNRDWIALLETAAPGEKVEDILREITDNALDPSNKQLRKLQAEREQERREAEELKRKVAEREATERQQQARASYRASLAARLASNDGLAKFKDDETFGEVVDSILNWQITNASRYDHLDQDEAEKQADADAIAELRRVIKLQSARWTKWLDDASESAETSDAQNGGESVTTQGAHGATKSVVRQISKAQGTGAVTSRKLTEAEEIAETARLLRQERMAARR